MDYFSYSGVTPKIFLRDARKNLNNRVTKCHYIPFSPYWYHSVSYHNLTPPQLEWYSYWRYQLQNGDFPTNDLSYIFLYTYEVLNMIGFDKPEKAYEQLENIWRYYRLLSVPLERYEWVVWDTKNYITARIHPIDRYLVDWIADFIVVHKLGIDVRNWYGKAAVEGAILSDMHLMVESWLSTDARLDQMNNDVLFALANYNPTQNKFYQDYEETYNLSEVYRQGLYAVHRHLTETGKGSKKLFARINRKYTVKRTLFEKVPHAYSRQRTSIVEIPALVKRKSMSGNLTGIIKYTDNIFRQRAGFRTKLRGFEIPKTWKDALEAQFEIKPDPIVIDFSQVSAISDSSESFRTHLIAKMDDAAMTEAQDAVAQNNTTKIKSISSEQVIRFHSLFMVFEQSGGQVAPDQLHEWFESAFISVIVDEFNEWAFEYIGDTPIITTEDGYYCLLEEYREDVAFLFEHEL